MKFSWLSANVSIAISLLVSTCVLHAETTINLHELEALPDKASENLSELMELPVGIHRIEPKSESINRILIAIHDANSQGFEWILPLQTIDDEHTDSYFLRWNPFECPSNSHEEVRKQLMSLLESDEEVSKVTLVGHGLGGVYLSQFVRDWRSLVSIDAHVIAAPLQGTIGVFNEKECGEILPKRLPPTIRYFQWRIKPSLHAEFKELSEDPQVVDLDGSLVISMPEMIAGESVDHTHALEIVATRISAEHLQTIESSTPAETNPDSSE
ncbi:MAG: hypothetical protein F4Z01_03245 [Gammaproteobacteria bacterium]|nr:hypothetical protein [Gammaproteobacteria bacterium]MYF37404.1 hypothetical protein [Gammaproteobacteria bacterium]